MSVNLLYRITKETEGLASNIIKQSPLEMREIDGNFVSISRAFDEVDNKIENINTTLKTKADTYSPQFTGSINIPTVSNSSFPKTAIEGSIVYNRQEETIYICTKGGDTPTWTSLSEILGAGSYVKREGDVMSGKLVAPSAEFQSPIVAMRPDSAQGKPLELVATNQWTIDIVTEMLDGRVGSAGNKNNIDIGGDVYCDRIYGDMDLGTLEGV